MSCQQIHEALSLLEKNAELATDTVPGGHMGAPAPIGSAMTLTPEVESELQTLRLSSLVAARCRKENIEFAERVKTAEER
jgi:hypothetical protein